MRFSSEAKAAWVNDFDVPNALFALVIFPRVSKVAQSLAFGSGRAKSTGAKFIP
jgi:hypothetical protein